MKQLRLVNIKNGKADLLVDEVHTTGAAKCTGKIGIIYFKINSGAITVNINKKGDIVASRSMHIPFILNETILHLLTDDAITNFGYETFDLQYDGRTIEKEYEDIKMFAHSFVEHFESFIQ